MSFSDLISETLLSLSANKARSFLTILGIVIGIMSVIVMVSIGQGTKASIEKSIQSVGSNLLTVMSGGFGRDSAGSAQVTFTMDDVNSLLQVPGVAAVAPQASSQYQVSAGTYNENVQITGTTVSLPGIRSITTTLGSWFSEGDQAGSAKVAVIGPDTSTNLFGEGSNPVGQRIRINGQPFRVIGVTASKGSSGFNNSDDVVYVPIGSLQRYLTGDDSISNIYVQATTQDQMSSVKQGITDLLMQRKEVTDSANPGFQVMSQQDLANTASTVTNLLTVLLGSIAGISLLVGGIGIMNMMLTTVTERIREIGLRKAVGATRGAITSQFLAEAVALTVIGGLVGILGGWGIASAISAFSSLQTAVTLSSVLLAVGVSTGIGIVFGYYPARRAAKLDPIEALRYQ